MLYEPKIYFYAPRLKSPTGASSKCNIFKSLGDDTETELGL